MNILYVTHRYWPYPGGSERYIQEMSKRLVGEGHLVNVITTDAWEIEHFFASGRRRIERQEDVHDGVTIRRVPARRLPFRALACKILSSYPSLAAKALFASSSPFVPSLKSELRKHRDADIVHSSAFPYDSLMYLSYAHARKNNIPFVITPFVHFGEPHEALHVSSHLSPFQVFVLQNSDLVIVQTQLEREALLSIPVHPDKVTVVGVGVSPEELIRGDGARFRRKHNISAHDTVILHVAEKSYLKGSIHLVEAVKRILTRADNIRIVFGGTSMKDFRDYMDRQERDIHDICTFTDFIPEKEKKDMFAACDIYAMPSKTDTFGIVYLEAWLSKKPVIGAVAGGVPEVISDGVDGFLVPFGNIYALSEYLWKLIMKKELRDAMGENGYRKVLTHHTWDKKYTMLKKIFFGVAKKTRQPK